MWTVPAGDNETLVLRLEMEEQRLFLAGARNDLLAYQDKTRFGVRRLGHALEVGLEVAGLDWDVLNECEVDWCRAAVRGVARKVAAAA